MLRVNNFQGNSLNFADVLRIAPHVEAKYERTRIQAGDVLITIVGTVGQVAIVPEALNGWNIARAVAMIRPKAPDLSRWISFFLRSPAAQHQLGVAANTTVQTTINLKDLRALQIPLPDRTTRGAITETLSALDDRIDNLRQTNTTLESIAAALFKSRFVDFDGVPPEDMQKSELGSIPKGWRAEEVGKLVQCVGGATPSTKDETFWNGGLHHWATPKDLSGLQAPILITTERRITDAGVARISSGLLPAGTLLMSSRAPIGYLAIAAVPVAINQGFIAMLPGGALSPVWLLFWAQVNMEAIKQKANGSTFMEISKAAFRLIKVALPPPDALAQFDEVAAPMLERIQNNERHIATLAAIRDALLPRLLSGQLRVPQ
ncbi:restriction endonuclease subunit S [Burkholderia pseudomallei]|uniref:restriction endonuclease subunit S n=1 Tax=Burkholderia pseudomallei TaxID=28450 RepID=UPI0015C36E32|nr:restriction endonuclease subunit S [Burkholderia pseudomallei]